MSDIADLFPGFAARWIDTEAGRIFARVGGEGPPLVLLHGFPQTHVMWHRVAPRLARERRVVVMDLRGYGWSAVPRADDGHHTWSKRAMGRDVVAVMEALGHVRFDLAGHDRGGRVAYRLALDEPGRLRRVAVLDIVPTLATWEAIEARIITTADHWLWLARPAPEPETGVGKAPIGYLDATLARWSAAKTLDPFDPRALAHYRAAFNDPGRIHAMCEDYRAGATVDREQDAADRAAGRRIAVPILALWGSGGIPASGLDPLAIWRDWADDVDGQAIDGGHFLPEEAPEATATALEAFFAPD